MPSTPRLAIRPPRVSAPRCATGRIESSRRPVDGRTGPRNRPGPRRNRTDRATGRPKPHRVTALPDPRTRAEPNHRQTRPDGPDDPLPASVLTGRRRRRSTCPPRRVRGRGDGRTRRPPARTVRTASVAQTGPAPRATAPGRSGASERATRRSVRVSPRKPEPTRIRRRTRAERGTARRTRPDGGNAERARPPVSDRKRRGGPGRPALAGVAPPGRRVPTRSRAGSTDSPPARTRAVRPDRAAPERNRPVRGRRDAAGGARGVGPGRPSGRVSRASRRARHPPARPGRATGSRPFTTSRSCTRRDRTGLANRRGPTPTRPRASAPHHPTE